jgi:hypothetical protein
VVTISASEELRERLFPDWDMELVDSADIRAVLLDAKQNASETRHRLALEQLLQELDAGQLSDLGKA